MRKVWVLSELYYPEETSTGRVLTAIAEGLANDFELGVITGPATLAFSSVPASANETKANVQILRCPGTCLNKNYLISRLLNLLSRSFSIFIRSLFECKKEDLILVVTNPPSLPFVAVLVSYLKGCKVALLVHDVYPDVLVATKLCKPDSLMLRLINKLQSYIYKGVSSIITLGRDMRNLICAKPGVDSRKVLIIPNWAETDLIVPESKSENLLLKSKGLSDKFVVLYAGNLGRTHDVDIIAQAAKRLVDCNNIHFLIVASGSKVERIKNFIVSERLSNLSFVDTNWSLPRNILHNACDVGILTFIPNMRGISVPHRAYAQFAAGKPLIVVADPLSEIALLVKEYNAGWVVKPGDGDSLHETLRFCSGNPDLCHALGKNALEIAKAHSFENCISKYRQLFKSLLDSAEIKELAA